MEGILVYTTDGWVVKWYDTTSFARGIHWEYTPIHPDDINNPRLIDGEKVEVKFKHEGEFGENRYVKLVPPIEERPHFVLLKDLPNCPKGRIFKEDINGNFFHSMSDEEGISGGYKSYKFTKEEVENNPNWFDKIN
jgi:hypothetical protein